MRAPMLPAAPALFSITTGWPMTGATASARMRAVMSGPVPAR